jgi:hypothetical protein
MAKPYNVRILTYKGDKVISITGENDEEYRMSYWALRHVLKELIDTDWFKHKKPTWKYKRLNYEETYKHLLYHPAIHNLINMEKIK